MVFGIVLGEKVFVGKLSNTSKKRLDLGIKLLKGKFVEKLILSGGVRERKGYEKLIGNYFSFAEIMKKYVIEKGVQDSQIILEDLSEDTVGQLIFLKEGILKPMKINQGIIITSDYHLIRIRKEVKKIFEKDYSFSYKLVKSNIFSKISEKKKEEKRIAVFYRDFGGVNFSNVSEVFGILFNKHPFYNQNPNFYKRELSNMIIKNSK